MLKGDLIYYPNNEWPAEHYNIIFPLLFLFYCVPWTALRIKAKKEEKEGHDTRLIEMEECRGHQYLTWGNY